MPDVLAVDLQGLRERVPYLGGHVGAGGPGWVRSTDLVERLAELEVDSPARDRRVWASSFFQGLAVRVLGVAAGLWVRRRRLPDVGAANTSITLQFGLPATISFDDGEVREGDDPSTLAWFADRAFAGHLDPVAAALRARRPLGMRLLWGNAAAAMAHAGLQTSLAIGRSGDEAAAEVTALLDAMPHGLGHLGTVDRADPDRPRSVFWARRNCCLWFLDDPQRAVCNSCSLLPADERRDRVAGTRPPGPAPRRGSR